MTRDLCVTRTWSASCISEMRFLMRFSFHSICAQFPASAKVSRKVSKHIILNNTRLPLECTPEHPLRAAAYVSWEILSFVFTDADW